MKFKCFIGFVFFILAEKLYAADTIFPAIRSDTAIAGQPNPIGIYLIQIIIFIIVLLVIAFILKKYSKRRGSTTTSHSFFQLIYTHYLGHSSYIQIYKIFDYILVLGISKDAVTPLLTISDKEKVDNITLNFSKQIKGRKFKDILKSKDIFSLIKETVNKRGAQ